MHLKSIAAILLGVLFGSGHALGVTIRVPLHEPTIQDGVIAAATGDTVLVAPGVYRGDGNKRISFYGRDIKLLSENGAASTIIDVEGFLEPDQAFRIEHGETPAALIDGFTIRNGYLEIGGGAGMFIGSSSPTVRNCVFVDNWMGSAYNDVRGGAVAVENGSPTFTNCSFINNRVSSFGEPPGFGSIGGAVYFQEASPLFTSCTFQSNSALGTGGSGGGGAMGGYGSLTLIGCALYGNVADLEGGAVAFSGSELIIDNTILAFNESGSTAGGIFCALASLHISNCTLHGNSADQEGGGILLWNSPDVLIENTIVAFSESGGAITCVSQGATVLLRCSDLFGNVGGDWTDPCIASQLGSAGNTSVDPLFCNALERDFHLDVDSPCSPDNAPPGCGLIGALGVACATAGMQEHASPTVRELQVLRNPASGTAEFEIIPVRGQVLEIFGVGGRLIERLPLLNGASRAIWHPSASIPPGVYFAALRPKEGSSSVKFILLRP